MDQQRRKELKEQAKQVKIYMGVYQIKNNENGKILIGTASNLKSRWLTLKNQLEVGRYMNSALQKEWNEFGEDAFSYEVLEQKSTEDISDIKWELEKMLKAWLEKLEPYGDRGYNKKKN